MEEKLYDKSKTSLNLTQIYAVIAVLRAELITYIQKKFSKEYQYVDNLAHDSLSEVVNALHQEQAAIDWFQSQEDGSSIISAMQNVGNWGKEVIKKLYLSNGATPYWRLPHLNYFASKANALEALVGALSEAERVSYLESKESVAEIRSRLCIELSELDGSLNKLLSVSYRKKVQVIIGNETTEIHGMLGGNKKSTLADTLRLQINEKFNFDRLSKVVFDYAESVSEHKQDHDNLIREKVKKGQTTLCRMLVNMTRDHYEATQVVKANDNNLQKEQDDLSTHINSYDAHGLTPLHRSINRNSKKTVQLLLDQGANVNLNTKAHGYPPLVLAVIDVSVGRLRDEVDLELVDLLIRYGADVNEVVAFYKNGKLNEKPIVTCNLLHILLFKDYEAGIHKRHLRKKLNLALIERLLKAGISVTDKPENDPSEWEGGLAINAPGIIASQDSSNELRKLLIETGDRPSVSASCGK